MVGAAALPGQGWFVLNLHDELELVDEGHQAGAEVHIERLQEEQQAGDETSTGPLQLRTIIC
jgi:hypothetical protein